MIGNKTETKHKKLAKHFIELLFYLCLCCQRPLNPTRPSNHSFSSHRGLDLYQDSENWHKSICDTLNLKILREVTAHTTVPLCGLFLGFFLKTTHRTKLS